MFLNHSTPPKKEPFLKQLIKTIAKEETKEVIASKK